MGNSINNSNSTFFSKDNDEERVMRGKRVIT